MMILRDQPQVKQAVKIKEKKNEKHTKKDDDPKRPTTGKQAAKIEGQEE